MKKSEKIRLLITKYLFWHSEKIACLDLVKRQTHRMNIIGKQLIKYNEAGDLPTEISIELKRIIRLYNLKTD